MFLGIFRVISYVLGNLYGNFHVTSYLYAVGSTCEISTWYHTLWEKVGNVQFPLVVSPEMYVLPWNYTNDMEQWISWMHSIQWVRYRAGEGGGGSGAWCPPPNTLPFPAKINLELCVNIVTPGYHTYIRTRWNPYWTALLPHALPHDTNQTWATCEPGGGGTGTNAEATSRAGGMYSRRNCCEAVNVSTYHSLTTGNKLKLLCRIISYVWAKHKQVTKTKRNSAETFSKSCWQISLWARELQHEMR